MISIIPLPSEVVFSSFGMKSSPIGLIFPRLDAILHVFVSLNVNFVY